MIAGDVCDEQVPVTCSTVKGIPDKKILKYGFAFEGEKCLIRKAQAPLEKRH